MILTPSKKELIVLKIIEDGKWWYGLDIVRASNRQVGRGTIYTVLDFLHQRGFITERKETDEEFNDELSEYKRAIGMNRRHLYRITRNGKMALNEAETTSSEFTPAWRGAV